MTLGQWLQEATGTFPRGVRERLAQEYKAHLDDGVASEGSEDALELFGNPQMVAKVLTRLYVTSDRLKLLEEMPRGWYRYLILVNLWAPAYSLSYRVSALSVSCHVMEMIAFSGIMFFMVHWTKRRQVVFRNGMSMAIALAFSGLLQTLQFSVNHFSGVVFLVSMPCIAFYVSEILKDDRRIRQTLRIEDLELEARGRKNRF